MTGTGLIEIAKSAEAISAFVSGSGLKEAVTAIVGDIHLDAAKLALETAKISVRPRDRINSVITHLEAAHAAYASIHGKAGGLAMRSVEWQAIRNAVAKDAWVCCVMAICYRSLGEHAAVDKYLLLADAAFANGQTEKQMSNGEALLGVPLTILGLFNPRNWDIQDQLMTVQSYEQFKIAMRSGGAAH